jgi:hypothetical protein
MITDTSTVYLPLKTKVFVELIDFLREKGSDRDPASILEPAIMLWQHFADEEPDVWMPEVSERPQHLGYMWKNLLLPPGTNIRMTYKHVAHHANIEGDDFTYQGKKTSPSEFANTVANGTARNAWRDLWVKRPHDRDFRLADEIRRAEGKGPVGL